MITLLEKDGIEINKADEDGITPLHMATAFEQKKIVQIVEDGAK